MIEEITNILGMNLGRGTKLTLWKLQCNRGKTKEDIIIGKIPCSWIKILNFFFIMTVLLNVIYRGNRISIKISAYLYTEIYSLILKCIWDFKTPRVGKIDLKENYKVKTHTSLSQN